MAYTEFLTDGADYVLQLGNHLLGNDPRIFRGVDALVMETGRRSLQYILRNNPTSYARTISLCEHYRIPIFGTDVTLTIGGYIRSKISGLPEIPSIPINLFYAFSENRTGSFVENLYANYMFLLQTSMVEGRNAINARKIEEYVVPKVADMSGKQKPRIGLAFGAGHVGLKHDLISKQRRNFTLWNFRNLNFGRYSGFNSEELEKVYEAHCNGRRWQVTEHRTGLFP